MEAALRTVEETVETLTIERDALAARVTELEHLSRVAAAEVAAVIAEGDREHAEHDRIEDERTRASTRAAAAAAERDAARAELGVMTDRAIAAETRAAVAEAVAAERLARIEDLRAAIETLDPGVGEGSAPPPSGDDRPAP